MLPVQPISIGFGSGSGPSGVPRLQGTRLGAMYSRPQHFEPYFARPGLLHVTAMRPVASGLSMWLAVILAVALSTTAQAQLQVTILNVEQLRYALEVQAPGFFASQGVPMSIFLPNGTMTLSPPAIDIIAPVRIEGALGGGLQSILECTQLNGSFVGSDALFRVLSGQVSFESVTLSGCGNSTVLVDPLQRVWTPSNRSQPLAGSFGNAVSFSR